MTRYRKLELKCVICHRLSGQGRDLKIEFRDLGGAEVEAVCNDCYFDKWRIDAWKKENWRD